MSQYDRDDEGYDPFSEEIGHQNILIAGLAGRGKTFLGTTMPGKVAYLMVESHAQDNIKQAYIHHNHQRGKIHTFPIRNRIDSKDPRGRRLLKNEAGKELTATQVLKDRLAKFARDPGDFDSVVVDSLTALQEIDKFWTQGVKSKLTQNDWMGVIDNIAEIAMLLRDLRLHTMAIVTTDTDKDDQNRFIQKLSLFGSKLPTNLPRYFNLAATVHSIPNKDTGKRDRKAILADDPRFITKPHLALDDIEDLDVSKWFDKMNKFWGEHGAQSLPDHSEVTVEETDAEKEEQALQARLSNPELNALFDKIKAPNGKRLAGLKKYPDDDELKKVLQSRIDEMEASKQ